MKYVVARFFLCEGGVLTATTYIRPYKAAGKGAVQTMEERFDYGLNPKKLGAYLHTSAIRLRLPLSFCW